MPAVHGPTVAQHPTSFQAHNVLAWFPCSTATCEVLFLFCPALYIVANYGFFYVQPTKAAPPQPQSTRPDPYYGHESTAQLCGRFITHLFACPEYPPTSSGSNTKLPHFIAYALHRMKLHPSVTPTTESSFPYGLRILGSSTIHLCLHNRLQGHL